MLLVELRVETRRSVPTCAQQNSTTKRFSVEFKALTLRRAQVILLLPQNLLCSLSPSRDEANLSFLDVLKQNNLRSYKSNLHNVLRILRLCRIGTESVLNSEGDTTCLVGRSKPLLLGSPHSQTAGNLHRQQERARSAFIK